MVGAGKTSSRFMVPIQTRWAAAGSSTGRRPLSKASKPTPARASWALAHSCPLAFHPAPPMARGSVPSHASPHAPCWAETGPCGSSPASHSWLWSSPSGGPRDQEPVAGNNRAGGHRRRGGGSIPSRLRGRARGGPHGTSGDRPMPSERRAGPGSAAEPRRPTLPGHRPDPRAENATSLYISAQGGVGLLGVLRARQRIHYRPPIFKLDDETEEVEVAIRGWRHQCPTSPPPHRRTRRKHRCSPPLRGGSPPIQGRLLHLAGRLRGVRPRPAWSGRVYDTYFGNPPCGCGAEQLWTTPPRTATAYG